MAFVVGSFVVVAIFYGIELRSRRRPRVFTTLFWFFVLQAWVLIGAEIILAYHLDQCFPEWIRILGRVITTAAFLTIGFTPIVAMLAGLLVMTLALKSKRKGHEPSEEV
ncbi:MAG TPA: hypothetical protein DHW67_17040 [Agrobacterium sp.]|nr:hypothetical protein RP007_05526 [Rhizobium sp. P007]HCJ73202.1 hypothetical protein [Agrobacterium sp.]